MSKKHVYQLSFCNYDPTGKVVKKMKLLTILEISVLILFSVCIYMMFLRPAATSADESTNFHYTCSESHMCVKTWGYGKNTCSSSADCKPKCMWEDCISPTPTPTVTITPTPTGTPSASTGGQGVQPANPHTDTTEAPGSAVCNIPFSAPVITGFSSDGNGSVTFTYLSSATGVQKFSVNYGYTADSLIFGQDNIPSSSRSIQINLLTPGKSVFAQIGAWINGCVEYSNIFDPVVR